MNNIFHICIIIFLSCLLVSSYSFTAKDSNGATSAKLTVEVVICDSCVNGNCNFESYDSDVTEPKFGVADCECNIGWEGETHYFSTLYTL